MKKVAVVILNFNGGEMLRRFLPSVISNSPEAEVYVADNGSSDASCEIILDEFSSVHLIRFDQNYGFAEGYNRALAQIKEEYLVLLNSDVEVTPAWLAPMVEYLDGNPDVAACQPKLLSYADKTVFEYAGGAGGFIDKWGYPYCRGRIFSTVEKDSGQYDDIVEVFWATGAALMVRNQDYKQAGGLDGRFFAHMEEIDFCWRLRSRGRKIVCIPQSKVYHVGAATLKKENPRKTYLNFRNNLLMLFKNTPEPRLASVMLFRKIFDNIAAIKFLASGSTDNFKAVMQARKDFYKMRKDFETQRAENMNLTTLDPIPEQMDASILFSYYILGKHNYSSLK